MHHRRAFSLDRVRQQQSPNSTARYCSNSCSKTTPKFRATSNSLLGRQSKRQRYEDYSQNLQQQQPSFFTKKTVAIQKLINDYFKDEEYRERQVPIIKPRMNIRMQFNRDPEQRKIRGRKKEEEELSQSVQVQEKKRDVLSWNVNKKNSHLPPINQSSQHLEGGCPQERSTSSFFGGSIASQTFRSTSTFSQYCDPQKVIGEKMVLAFENQIFQVFILLKNGRPISRVKSFKAKGMPILQRQMKIKNYGMGAIWTEAKINPYTYETGMQPPLKDLVCKVGIDQANPNNLRIRVKPLFKRLSANGFQELRSLARSFCLDLLKVKGKVINNKVNPENIFLTKEYKLCLAQWGYSSFRDAFNTQSNAFQSRLDPILRGEQDWFVSPEYLAPEIISNMLGNIPQDIWKGQSSPDIWSLGLVIYQMMTLIPIWSTAKCLVSYKNSQCSTISHTQRVGLLGMPGRDLKKLQEKQTNVQKQLLREMEGWSGADRKLGKIVLKMLHPSLQLRISWSQLISEL